MNLNGRTKQLIYSDQELKHTKKSAPPQAVIARF